MYVPEHFREDEIDEMHALMRAFPFASLVSSGSDGLFATHLPTVLTRAEDSTLGVIEGHLARANPQWKQISEGGDCLYSREL